MNLSYYQTAFKKSFDFKGLTTRVDFWSFVLIDGLITSLLYSLFLVFVGLENNYYYSDYETPANFFIIIYLLYTFLTIFPRLTIFIRRLRDAGKHWANYFFWFLPIIGWILLLIYVCEPSSTTYRVESPTTKLDDTEKQLVKLISMLENGIITKEEYQSMRKRVIET